jgi:hypothetical protein
MNEDVNLKPLKIEDKYYNIEYDMDMNDKEYVFLRNTLDDEDIMCLRVTESDEFGLEKLDSDDELMEVLTEFYKREREELEN